MYTDQVYGLAHDNGSQQVSDEGDSAFARNKYPDAWRYVSEVLMPPDPDSFFRALTRGLAAILDGVWSGNGAGFIPGVMCTSRNHIYLPQGIFLMNQVAPVSFGGMYGHGTGGVTMNGNDHTVLAYDHGRWIDRGGSRAVLRSVNWGTNVYLESATLDGIRVDGRGPNWRDTSYVQNGVELQMLGEDFGMGTDLGFWVERCNNNGLWINGAGPGKVETLCSHQHNEAAVLYTSPYNDNLGHLRLDYLSADNSAYGVRMVNGGRLKLGTCKFETGLSASYGKPNKSMAPLWLEGWVGGSCDLLTLAVDSTIEALIHLKNITNMGRFHIETVSGWRFDSLVLDHRSGTRYYFQQPTDGHFKHFSMTVNSYAGQTAVRASHPTDVMQSQAVIQQAPFHSNGDRLGIVTNPTEYDYAQGLPLWDDTGGNVAPPPPTAVVTSITVSITPVTVAQGGVAHATAIVRDQNDNVMNGQSIAWSIVSGPATIDASGTIVTTGAGTVVAMAAVASVSDTSTLLVTEVAPPPPPSGAAWTGGPYVMTPTSYESVDVVGVTEVQVTALIPDTTSYGRILGTGKTGPSMYVRPDGHVYWANTDGSRIKLTQVPMVVGEPWSGRITLPAPQHITCIWQVAPHQGGAQTGSCEKIELFTT